MKKQYKIIKESDGNGQTHYELWVAHKFLWMTRWSPLKDHKFRYTITKRFDKESEIYDWIRSQEITRTVVKDFEA